MCREEIRCGQDEEEAVSGESDERRTDSERDMAGITNISPRMSKKYVASRDQ
jgi:hypothetical protein